MAGPLSIARRVRQLAIRLLPETSIVRVEGLQLEVDPRTQIGRTLWRGRPFEARERQLALELVRTHYPDRAIVDIGAHIGLHALTWARALPATHVIAIEPSPATCARLARNVARNHLSVEVREVAVSDHVGEADLHVTADDAYAGLSDTRRMAIQDLVGVEVTTLDTIARELRVGLVKIDVEGHEDDVIRGGRHVLLRDRPVLFVEIYGGVASNPDPDGTVARICELGYTAHVVGPRGLEPAGRHDDARYNYFFLPSASAANRAFVTA